MFECQRRLCASDWESVRREFFTCKLVHKVCNGPRYAPSDFKALKLVLPCIRDTLACRKETGLSPRDRTSSRILISLTPPRLDHFALQGLLPSASLRRFRQATETRMRKLAQRPTSVSSLWDVFTEGAFPPRQATCGKSTGQWRCLSGISPKHPRPQGSSLTCLEGQQVGHPQWEQT